jgi:hypothetical protein
MKESSYQKVSRQMIEEYDTAGALACRVAELEGFDVRSKEGSLRAVDVYWEERDRLHPAV